MTNTGILYPYFIVDVFSERAFGGNQLAVLPSAQGISVRGMQCIAREFNFAETTFVLPARKLPADCRVRIFTPKAEVPFAGHPTVGTACALVLGGLLGGGKSCDLVFEEGVGPVRIRVERSDNLITGALTLEGGYERPDARPDLSALAQILKVARSDVLTGFYASVGLPFCFASLSSREAVDSATIDKAAWSKHLENAWSPNIFFFAGELRDGAELYARMCAPALGVEEDPATGSACAALVGVLASDATDRRSTYNLKIIQGVAMGRRSDITAIAHKRGGKLVSVGVGGATAFVSRGEIEVPRELLD